MLNIATNYLNLFTQREMMTTRAGHLDMRFLRGGIPEKEHPFFKSKLPLKGSKVDDPIIIMTHWRVVKDVLKSASLHHIHFGLLQSSVS